MPYPVLRALVERMGNFGEQVAAYTRELNIYAEHMRRVASNPHEYHPYPPPQASSQVILNSVSKVDEIWIPDFVVVERLPVEPGTLRIRQNELFNEIGTAQNEAAGKLLATGRWAAHSFRYADIMTADNERSQLIVQRDQEARQARMDAFIKKTNEDQKAYIDRIAAYQEAARKAKPRMVNGELTAPDPPPMPYAPNPTVLDMPPTLVHAEVRKQVEAGRSPADHKFVQEHEARHRQLDTIQRHAAKLMFQVEDLTEKNLHLWVMEPFPEIPNG